MKSKQRIRSLVRRAVLSMIPGGPERSTDVLRVRMPLDPGVDGVVKLTAFGKGIVL